jgi:hypothetical protein
MSIESPDNFRADMDLDPAGAVPVEVEFDYILRRLAQECAAAFGASHGIAHNAHLAMAKVYADRASSLARYAVSFPVAARTLR